MVWHCVMHEEMGNIREYKGGMSTVTGLQTQNRLLCKFTKCYKGLLKWDVKEKQ